MSTADALQDLEDVRAPPTSRLLDETEGQEWAVEEPPTSRVISTLIRAIRWIPIAGLLALGGLWSHVTAFEVVARFIVEAGAIVVMAQSLLARRWAALAVAAVLALLYNPLAPVFDLSGAWQRAVFVAVATPFLALLIWRDLRTDLKA